MKQHPFRPNRRLFERSYTAFRQRREADVKLFIESKPRRFVAPFEMPSVRASIVPRCIIPSDAKRPVRAGQST
jgi:hypothetical protein